MPVGGGLPALYLPGDGAHLLETLERGVEEGADDGEAPAEGALDVLLDLVAVRRAIGQVRQDQDVPIHAVIAATPTHRKGLPPLVQDVCHAQQHWGAYPRANRLHYIGVGLHRVRGT